LSSKIQSLLRYRVSLAFGPPHGHNRGEYSMFASAYYTTLLPRVTKLFSRRRDDQLSTWRTVDLGLSAAHLSLQNWALNSQTVT
jgi:hypothetical protein